MKYIISLFLSALFLSFDLYSQNIALDWVNGSKYHVMMGKANMALSPQNDIYTTGYFEHTVNFEPGTTDHILTSNGWKDIFIKKVDHTGNLVWVKQLGSAQPDKGDLLITDQLGNIYTMGYFNSTTDFDPGAGIHNLTNNAADDVYLLKLDPNGNFLWVKQFDYFDLKDIVMHTDNTLYILGRFSQSIDLDPGSSSEIVTPNHADDYFILKLNDQGNYIWSSHLGSSSVKIAQRFTLDSSGHLYTVGHFSDTIDVDPGSGTYPLYSAPNVKSTFVQKLDANGDFVWAKKIGNASSGFAQRIVTDNQNNVFVTGLFQDTLYFSSNPNDYIVSASNYSRFLFKYTSTGTVNWAKNIGLSGGLNYTSIRTDQTGALYFSGVLGHNSDLDPGPDVYHLPVVNGDMFMQKLDNNGDFVWAFRIGDTENGWDAGYNSILDSEGNIYSEMLAGQGGNIIDFDPGPDEYNISTTNEEQTYLLKFGSCFTQGQHNVSTCGEYTWMDGITYTSSNTTATHTIPGTFSCDSVITLNLDLQPIDLSIAALGQFIGANQTGASYQWLSCDDNYAVLPGETQSTFSSNVYGNFAVEITYNGCVDTSACTTINTIGTDEIDGLSSVSIFPNPTESQVYMEFGTTHIKHIYVFNALGQIVHQIKDIKDSEYTFHLNQPAGIYTIEVYSNQAKKTFKLVKL